MRSRRQGLPTSHPDRAEVMEEVIEVSRVMDELSDAIGGEPPAAKVEQLERLREMVWVKARLVVEHARTQGFVFEEAPPLAMAN
jgi:hypothetical protein